MEIGARTSMWPEFQPGYKGRGQSSFGFSSGLRQANRSAYDSMVANQISAMNGLFTNLTASRQAAANLQIGAVRSGTIINIRV